MSSPAIEATGLGKSFGVVRHPGSGLLRYVRPAERSVVEAVRDVTLTVERGEAVACLGPNGAGKSTLLKMLTGVLEPSTGHVQVLARNPTRDRLENTRWIGAVFGQRSQLWPDVSIMRSFHLLRRIHGIPDQVFTDRLSELLDLLDLSGLTDRTLRTLSLGERVKADIVAALLHRPDVVFLDEPTIGLDVTSKARVRSFLREQHEREAMTLILTSHDIDDVSATCDRLVTLRHGAIDYDGSIVNYVSARAQLKQIVMTFASVDAAEISASRWTLPPECEARLDGLTLRIELGMHPGLISDLLVMLREADSLVDLEILTPSLGRLIENDFNSAG